MVKNKEVFGEKEARKTEGKVSNCKKQIDLFVEDENWLLWSGFARMTCEVCRI